MNAQIDFGAFHFFFTKCAMTKVSAIKRLLNTKAKSAPTNEELDTHQVVPKLKSKNAK
jgi:hypothetical protein